MDKRTLTPSEVATSLKPAQAVSPVVREAWKAEIHSYFDTGAWKADSLLASGASNAKTAKSESATLRTKILYLAPAGATGLMDVCPWASAGCRAACLFTAGRGAMRTVADGRLRKSYLFAVDRPRFLTQLGQELDAFQRLALRKGFQAVVRLNGTSDLPWEVLLNLGRWPMIRFYDYTKNPNRMRRFLTDPSWPSNYDLTFSRSEDNEAEVLAVLQDGGRVAVPFAPEIPASYLGFPVVVGDESDLRFLDGKGVVVGLTAKGSARKDRSGFVVQVEKE